MFDKKFMKSLLREDRGDIPEIFSFEVTECVGIEYIPYTYVVNIDVDYDYDWLDCRGKFQSNWQEGCLELHNGSDRHNHRYFMPEYTIAERCKDMIKRGYSRGVADYEARKDVYSAMKIAANPYSQGYNAVCVEVTVYLRGQIVGSYVRGEEVGSNMLCGIEIDDNSEEYLDEIIMEQLNEARCEALKNNA